MSPICEPKIVLERLRRLPGGEVLLDAAAGRSDVEFVGGAVRDLLLERDPRELDVVVGGDAASFGHEAALFARELGSRLSILSGGDASATSTSEHERFGTAFVEWDGGRIDVATRRAESYAAPGALPDVRAGTPEEDLQRRDFTVNAIAISLSDGREGALRHMPGALEDLEARRLRVLHQRSFLEDPTRLLRMARYAARLDFEVEEGTAALAEQAIVAGALETVSGARIGAELRLALAEPEPLAALAAMSRLGLLGALHPRLRFEEPVASATLALLPADGRADLALLASLVLPLALRIEGDSRAEILALLDRWDYPSGDRDRVATAAAAVPRLIAELPAAERPSALYAIARGIPLEGVALAGALGCEKPAREWLERTRHVRLAITGEDLLAAGISQGPEIGRRLQAVLRRRLDGELSTGREEELKAALDDGAGVGS
jgi:tRNA nucleotidyltransferase (CCA-adding enzyme)